MGRFTQKIGVAILAALCMAGARGASAQTASYTPGPWLPVTNITAEAMGLPVNLGWGDFSDLVGVQIYASPTLENADWQLLGEAATNVKPLPWTENVYPLSTVNAVIGQNDGQHFYRLRAVKGPKVTWDKVEHTLRVNLLTGATAVLAADYNVLSDPFCKSTNLYLRSIRPAGETFMMGSPDGEVGRFADDAHEAQHEVTLTKPYYIGVFTVTQKQWDLLGATGQDSVPDYPSGDCPRDYVTWNAIRGASSVAKYNWPTGREVDPASFMGLLRALVKNGSGMDIDFDLPTEAQWEYACRAGTTNALSNGKELTSSTETNATLDEVAWYDSHQPGTARYSVVGALAPNAAGLYDMHGNMWESCLDWFTRDITGLTTDPVGPDSPDSGFYRVRRGGGWDVYAGGCRSAQRFWANPLSSSRTLGFRVAGTPVR